jgi:hypothetical protein
MATMMMPPTCKTIPIRTEVVQEEEGDNEEEGEGDDAEAVAVAMEDDE